MTPVRITPDLEECRDLWTRTMPDDLVSDLWVFRACFQDHFRRPACFIVEEGPDGVRGLLPLSWIEEAEAYGYFPGETWEAKTWLEQNRILAADERALDALLGACPSPYHLRYLLPVDAASSSTRTVDEIGYLFLPPKYDYDIENYFQEFSHRSAKRLKKELAAFDARGIEFRYDDFSDFDLLVDMNMGRFGERSYFADRRFLDSFRALMRYLEEQGWLRFTTVLVAGEPAAVDMGCVYRGIYTLLGGGTHGGYPGIAKVINMRHMVRACEERLDGADFLCGDFAWKDLFHLTERPLYLISNAPCKHDASHAAETRSAACVG